MHKLKVTTIGSSAGVVLPKEVLARLKVGKGDTLYLTETAEGYVLSPYDPAFEEEMTAARRVMRRYRSALRHLVVRCRQKAPSGWEPPARNTRLRRAG